MILISMRHPITSLKSGLPFPDYNWNFGSHLLSQKIASMVGTSVEVDHRTVARININGPRFHVIVDAKTPPLDSIKIRLPNGKVILQKIKFDFYPLYYANCKRMGHSTITCRWSPTSNHVPSTAVRGKPNAGVEEDGWQQVRGRRNRQQTNIYRNLGGRGSGTWRSKSRQPGGRGNFGGRSISQSQTMHAPFLERTGPSAAARGAIPTEIHNAHTYIQSPLFEELLLGHNPLPLEGETHTLSQPLEVNTNNVIRGKKDLELHQHALEPTHADDHTIYDDDALSETPSQVLKFPLEDLNGKHEEETHLNATDHGTRRPYKGKTAQAKEPPMTTRFEGTATSQPVTSTSSLSEWMPSHERKTTTKMKNNNKKRAISPKKARGGAVGRPNNRLK